MNKFYALAAAAVATLSMNAQSLYVCGAGEGLGWDPAAPKEVALEGDAYTFSIDDLSEFKISTNKGTWNDFNAGALCCADMTEEMLGTPVALSAGDANIGTPWPGNYTVSIAGDLSTITMTTTTPKPTGYTAIYLRGSMNSWGSSEMWQMQTEDGVTYTFNCAGETKLEAGTTMKIGADPWGNYNYGAGGDVVFNTEMTWNFNANDSKITEDFEGKVTIVFSGLKQPAAVTFTKTSSVESIETETAEAEYFNMQGVRVANPEKGLYIVRQGSKVSKVML